MNATEIRKLLGLEETATLVEAREKVRGMENRALDSVAAQAVCGWTYEPFEGYHDHQGGVWGKPHMYSDSLDSAAAMMSKIEEMGLKGVYNAHLITITSGEEVTPLEDDGYPCWALTDDDVWAIANATPRQRTEAAVLAVISMALAA